MLPNWLQVLFPRKEGNRTKWKSPPFGPWVESLEPRDVPSTLLASGFQGGTGIGVGPGGMLYVTEGAAGRIARVDPNTGEVSTFASGLPIGPFGGYGGGANDIAFIGSKAYILISGVAEDVGGHDVVGLYRVDGPTTFTIVADIGAYASNHPPKTSYDLPTGIQYALDPYRGGFLVTDGHHNRVYYVTPDGQISEKIAFEDVVPTGLAVSGNTVYVAEAGPVPHLPSTGKVVSFGAKGTDPTTVASGAPLLVDVEFGRGNTLFALSQGHWSGTFEGDPADPNTGSLLKVNADGTLTAIEIGLNQPTSMEILGNTAFIFTLTGEIWQIDNIGERPYGNLVATSQFQVRQETLNDAQVSRLLNEALNRWQGVGATKNGLGTIHLQIGNLVGNTLGLASGNTIYLDDNAAGWGWFVDPTPWEDSEFFLPGDQGEQGRMDLLTVIMHEMGHVLGYGHEDHGVMQPTLSAGTRWGIDPHELDGLFAILATEGEEVVK